MEILIKQTSTSTKHIQWPLTIGDTSVNDPESQDIDSDSLENYQGDPNDQEYVEFDPPVALQHLTHKMEQLRQTVEDKDNDPRDAIKHLEQKRTHWGSTKKIYRHFV